jgi:hypothetical protein
MTRLRRLLRRRLAVAALTALSALALAVPAGARTSLEPGQSGPGSQGVSWRLADAASPQASGSQPVTLRLADASSPRVADTSSSTVATPHRRGVDVSDDSSVSVLEFVLALTGVAILAAGAATVVTTRVQRGGHSIA